MKKYTESKGKGTLKYLRGESMSPKAEHKKVTPYSYFELIQKGYTVKQAEEYLKKVRGSWNKL